MLRLATFLSILTVGNVAMSFAADEGKSTPEALNFTVKDIAGKDVDLAKYKGKVLLIVNVASECGLTPQYEGLETLHEKYADKGLAVLGFPCNQFGGQEPGSEADIQKFCKTNYKVQFDMFSKIDVNGDKQSPLYKHLTAQDVKPKGAGKVSWNFEKFVIGKDGKVIARFEPKTSPNDAALVKTIEDALAAK
jgi:glutathione peroxidase